MKIIKTSVALAMILSASTSTLCADTLQEMHLKMENLMDKF